MAAFSVNQVRQLYVVNQVQSSKDALKTPGDVFVDKDKADNIFLQYVGALGDLMRSDIMTNITYAKATASDEMAIKLKGYKLTLDPKVNGGQPVAGQDYILRLAFREFIGMSESDQYFKYGMVHAFSGLSASDFYKQLAVSLAVNMSKEVTPLVKVYAHSASTKAAPFNAEGNIEILPEFASKMNEKKEKNPFYSGSAIVDDIDSIFIVEVAQPWHLGTMPQGVIPFEVQPVNILVDGDNRLWGKVEAFDPKVSLPEGQLIADLEYFCMGERGDQYRNVGWPNVIPTKYMVDPSKEYDVINIHYYYQGEGISVQKSEKDIQIACLNDGSHTLAKSLVSKIEEILGAGKVEETKSEGKVFHD